jgi:hypothetical protein
MFLSSWICLLAIVGLGGGTEAETRSSLSSFRRPVPETPFPTRNYAAGRRLSPQRRLVRSSTLSIYLLGGLGLLSLSLAVVCLCAYLLLSVWDCWVGGVEGAAKSVDEDDGSPQSIQDTSTIAMIDL